MRIRKRLALSSIPTSDLQLIRRSEAAPPSDQPSDQSMAIHGQNNRWVFPKHEEKMKQKEFGDDETLSVEAKKSTNNDIRKIVNICDGGEDFKPNLHPSSSSSVQGDYNVVPLKKRKGIFDRTPNEETMNAKMKSKTNKKCGDSVQVDQKENGSGVVKKSKRGNVIMEGSRCSRVNGRGWRCCQPTLVGYSLCEHHLGKGRLRSMATGRRGGGGAPPQDEDSKQQHRRQVMVTKKKTKARSMSSLLSQT